MLIIKYALLIPDKHGNSGQSFFSKPLLSYIIGCTLLLAALLFSQCVIGDEVAKRPALDLTWRPEPGRSVPVILNAYRPLDYFDSTSHHTLNLDAYIKPKKYDKHVPLLIQDSGAYNFVRGLANYKKEYTPVGVKKTYQYRVKQFKVKKHMKVRGFEVSENIYFGQTKIAKEWGYGLVIDKGSYAYGISNQGAAFYKEF